MNKVKLRLITLISFLVLFALLLGLGFGALAPKRVSAATTYTPASIFWSRTGGEVRAYKKDSGEETPAYVTFVLNDGGSVEYHRDLALKWFESALSDEEGDEETEGTEATDVTALVNPGQAVYFSMEFSFGQVNFSKYTIVFQSAEENVTKEAQSVNTLVFEESEGKVLAYIKDASHAKDDDFTVENAENTIDVTAAESIRLAFTEENCDAGEFAVMLNDELLGKFTNVGGNFMEYRTSGTANTPMTFKAELTDAAKTDGATQKVFMKELNGQPLVVENGAAKTSGDEVVTEKDGTVEYVDGKVTDKKAAALVLSEKVYGFSLGQRFSLDYEAIDVLYDNPVVRRSFYMLKKETVEVDGAETETWHKPKEEGDDDYKTLSTTDYFMPPDDSKADQKEYVSIRFTINDERDGALSEFIYLTWYADLDANVVETIGEGENAFDYLLVAPADSKQGPYYTVLEATEGATPVEKGTNTPVDVKDADGNDVVDAYQSDLQDAANNIGAGSGAYFYLPSLRSLIKSDYADYRNLRFTVCYYKPVSGSSASTESSLRYNNLRFQVEKAGLYRFRIFAADAAGNTMQYYDQDGKLVSVSSSNIWDIEGIPEFEVEIAYNGATIEDPGEQSVGYRGSSYSISSFEIIEGENCEKEYDLYFFDTTKLAAEQSMPSYSSFVENAEEYFTTSYKDCFTQIREYNYDISKSDKAWNDTDNDYVWDPSSSLTFTPMKSGYYLVRLTHTDPNRGGKTQYGYQVIDVRNPIDYTPGQSDWLQNNVTSVILFSISAVLAVVIVILFVVKPSDKNVEEVDLNSLKGKKSKK